MKTFKLLSIICLTIMLSLSFVSCNKTSSTPPTHKNLIGKYVGQSKQKQRNYIIEIKTLNKYSAKVTNFDNSEVNSYTDCTYSYNEKNGEIIFYNEEDREIEKGSVVNNEIRFPTRYGTLILKKQ